MDDKASPPSMTITRRNAAAPSGYRLPRAGRTLGLLARSPRSPRSGPATRNATIGDIDRDGFVTPATGALAIGATVFVDLPGLGTRQAGVVRAEGAGFACAWHDRLAEADLVGLGAGTRSVTMLIRPAEGFPEPHVSRFPALIRVGLIGGISGLLWIALYLARR